jgi:8-oxo-dGTP pyrophosphatase MutT (NUDIX family)
MEQPETVPAGLRSTTLRSHAGQISFPGGSLDNGEDVIDAALRESREEIGLNSDSVDIRGYLPGVVTVANYHIAPVLGVIDHRPDLIPSPNEVERILVEPLAPLLDRRYHGREVKEHEGRSYQTWVIKHRSEYIWGATAKMLIQWSQAMSTKNDR